MKKSVKKSKKQSKPKALYPNKLKKLIEDSVDRYLGVLGMNHYRTRIYYMKHDLDASDERMAEGSTVAATANVDMRYLRLSLKIYPHIARSWTNKNMSDNDVTEVIAHEVSHLATNHMINIATATYKDEGEMKDAWESLTTIIGRLVHEVDRRRGGLKKTKKK